MRLEEYSRLNDVRKNKIESLEQQLRSLGLAEGEPATDNVVPYQIKSNFASELRAGENLFEININGAVYSKKCSDYLHNFLPGFSSLDNLISFVIVDFYDFETAVSSIGVGSKPIFADKFRFTVSVDDFFLHYVQSGKVNIQVCISNGVDYYPIGVCTTNLSGLLAEVTDAFKYHGDIIALESVTDALIDLG